MLICIQPALMEELLFDYENVCQDEELMEEAEYKLYKGNFDKLTRQNDRVNNYKVHIELPDYTEEEAKDIIKEVGHIETSNVGEEKELKKAIRLFYEQNSLAVEVTLDQLKNMACWSSSTGRYSMPFHWKSKGKIFVLKD
jgi:hypothetical protein